jgi:Ca-activated chloride channel family protein
MMPRRGTGFPKLFERLDSIFTDNKAPGKVLLLSDDFQDIDIPMVSAFIQQNNVTLHIYPFATETGGAIRAFSNAKYPLKIKGKVEESALDTIKIKELKTIENLEVLDLTLDESDVRTLAKDISDNLLFEEKPKAEEENWEDNGYWLLIPLLVLFLFSFRKGWALYGLVFVMTLSSCSDVEKNPVNGKKEKFQFADLWYTKEYQAQKEYDNKNYTQAAEAFEDPLRKGVAYFKAGDLNKAKEAFEKDTSSTSKYNLALTYAKLGDLDKSQEIFTELVSKDPNNEDLKNNLLQVTKVMASMDTLQPEKVGLNEAKQTAKNKENDSQEDLGGGGQKATKKDMEKERLEETVDTGLRKGKELDELPDDFKSGKGEVPKNILMRKVDDDPALFLTRKFNYQVKKNQVTTEQTKTEW